MCDMCQESSSIMYDMRPKYNQTKKEESEMIVPCGGKRMVEDKDEFAVSDNEKTCVFCSASSKNVDEKLICVRYSKKVMPGDDCPEFSSVKEKNNG